MNNALNFKNTCCTLVAGLILIAGSTAARAETNSSCTNYDGCHKLQGTYQGTTMGMVDFRTNDGQMLEVPAGAVYWDTRPRMMASELTVGQPITIFQPRPYMLTVMPNAPMRSDGLVTVGSPDGVWFLPQPILTTWQDTREDMVSADR
jgi:hypothetical protein